MEITISHKKHIQVKMVVASNFFQVFPANTQSPDAKHWKVFIPTAASGTLADSISNFVLQF